MNGQRRETARLWDRGRILAAMLAIRAFRRPRYPFYVNLVINSRCTNRCAYCFGRYAERQRPDLPYEKFLALAELLAARGTRYVLIQGGEPLLHPDLGRMLGHLAGRRIVTALASNGQLPERIGEIPELDLMDNLCFSLDGMAEGNDRVRGTGTFARVLRSIGEVRRRYGVPVRINSTVHRHVAGDVHEMARLVRDQRLEWGCSFLFRGNEEQEGEPLGMSTEEIRAYLAELLAYKKRGYPIFTTSRVLRYAAAWPVPYDRVFLSAAEAAALPGFRPIHCQYGQYELVIDEDGALYPCQGMQGVFAAKNWERDGFDSAFTHLATKQCDTCYILPLMNTSAMINWDWRVIGETVWETLRNRFRPTASRNGHSSQGAR